MTRALFHFSLCVDLSLAAELVEPASLHAAEPGEQPSSEGVRLFESRIRPIPADNCVKCHIDKKQRGGLRRRGRRLGHVHLRIDLLDRPRRSGGRLRGPG